MIKHGACILMLLATTACPKSAESECASIGLGAPISSLGITSQTGFCKQIGGGKNMVGPVSQLRCCDGASTADAGCGVDCTMSPFGYVQFREVGEITEVGAGDAEMCCVIVKDGTVVGIFVGRHF